jgi:hypothetical protein
MNIGFWMVLVCLSKCGLEIFGTYMFPNVPPSFNDENSGEIHGILNHFETPWKSAMEDPTCHGMARLMQGHCLLLLGIHI